MKGFFGVFLILSLSACAFSPQQITIKPSAVLDSESYGMGRGLSVVVEDRRASKVLGSRGGVYKETSVVTIANSLTDAIGKATRASLAAQGFDVVNAASDAAEFKVVVETLGFDIPAQSLVSVVKLQAVLQVEASSHGEVYKGRYQTQSEHKLMGRPSTETNEEMINQLLTDTLARMFEDQKLRAFLSNI
jgi:uncharacterized lipoprotein